jgi:DNA-binding response OmpR family regulator
MLCRYLGGQGFNAQTVGDGVAMDAWLAHTTPAALVLDLMLPGEDGLSIARRLNGRLPFMVLSARGDAVDRIVGLEIGADDYLAKPFNPRELAARLHAILRRSARAASESATTLSFGDFVLQLDRRTLTRAGEPVAITTAEFSLLKLFAQHPGRVLSREELVELASGPDRIPFDRSIDVRVARLRKKIETNPDAPVYLRTVWGAGYLFVPDGQA